MTRSLMHRGPDGEGFYERGPAHLGHRRLSIIDLAGGTQPLANEDESVWIVFNGEIFNYRQLREQLVKQGHRFRTRSDTEVLVHAWEQYGEQCVNHLRGQFAFALWDNRQQMLFLARDRMGQKPLYYCQVDGRFCFASELKGLLADPAVPRELDPRALDAYLALLYVPDPWCIFQGIHKIPPAHVMRVTSRGIDLRRYWRPDFASKLKVSEAEALDRLDAELREATALRMISDVPLGAFLSGGVDSSLIVAYMAAASPRPVKTFTIGFEEATHDERSFARQVARRFGTEHEELVVRANEAEILPELARAFDEPFADASAIPVWYLSRMTREHVTVALNGDGGDESFAGYDRYRGMALFERYRRLPRWMRQGALYAARAAKPLPLGGWRAVRRIRDWSHLTGHPSGEVYQRTTTIPWEDRRAMYGADMLRQLEGIGPLEVVAAQFEACASPETIDRVMYADQQTYLPGDLLVKIDRMTMAHSLEGRSPLLDHRVVELAASLPAQLKYHRGRQKHLLKRLLSRYMPEGFLNRPKQGFGVPVSRWLRGQLREMLLQSLAPEGHLAQWGLFDMDQLRRMAQFHLAAQRDYGEALWRIVNLDCWCRCCFTVPRISAR